MTTYCKGQRNKNRWRSWNKNVPISLVLLSLCPEQHKTKQPPHQRHWPVHGWLRQPQTPFLLWSFPAGRCWGKEALPTLLHFQHCLDHQLCPQDTFLLLLRLYFALLEGRMKFKVAQHHQPSNLGLCCNLGYLVYSIIKAILFPKLSAIHICMKGHPSSLPSPSLATLHFSQKSVIPFMKSDKVTLGKFSIAKILYFGLLSSNRTWHP